MRSIVYLAAAVAVIGLSACAGSPRKEAEAVLPPGLQVKIPPKEAPTQEELLRQYWAARRGESAPTTNDVALPPPSATRMPDNRSQRRYDAAACSERGETGCVAALVRDPD